MRAAATLLLAWLLLAPLAAQRALAASAPSGAGAALDAAPATLQPGARATVRTGGDCLRLRDAPSLSAEVLTCLPDGTSVGVLDGAIDNDGYHWQQVTSGDFTGWTADTFLVPFEGPAQCAAATSSTKPGFTGQLPISGGVGLTVWGGGTVSGMMTAAAAKGCALASIWGNRSGGGLVGYIASAPDFVNAAFFEQYPNGEIPSGSPVITICGGPTQGQSALGLLPAWAGEPAKNSETPAPEISAEAAIVVDEASGAVLFGKEAHKPLAPASLTKVVTAIVALEGAESDDWVVSQVDSRQMPGSSIMGLLPGDCFQLRDLLYGLMLPSGNDAALAIARYVAGSDAAFVDEMHALVGRLGLHESHFIDPHGLGGDGHATSAYDLAMLSRYGMSLPEFQTVVGTRSWSTGGPRQIVLYNVNSFLAQYPGADGLKTGFTEDAGRTLIASATHDGHRLYAVLLDAPQRFDDAAALLDWAFANYDWP